MITPINDSFAKEFLDINDIIEKYEEPHFQLGLPALLEMIELGKC